MTGSYDAKLRFSVWQIQSANRDLDVPSHAHTIYTYIP